MDSLGSRSSSGESSKLFSQEERPCYSRNVRGDAATSTADASGSIGRSRIRALQRGRHDAAPYFGLEASDDERPASHSTNRTRQEPNLDVSASLTDSQLRTAKLETLGSLAGGLAHEFNNLLQAVIGYAGFALKSLDETHPAHADALIAVSAAERAASLARRLLGFCRDEPHEMAVIDANAAIRECAAFLLPLLEENVEIELVLNDEVDPIVADRDLFQQMLINLCLNARDAMPFGGRISVETSASRMESPGDAAGSTPCLQLTISDDGCGMNAEVVERIFEPFFTTKSPGKGTGLGLPMVRETVRLHGGAISVESEPDAGARFIVRLPFAPSDDAVPTDRSAARPAGTILVADDEPLLRDLVQRSLEIAGYRVLTARDGVEALDSLKANDRGIDLAVLDVGMPRMSGWAVLREIRRTSPSLPVVMVTAHDRSLAPTSSRGETLLRKPFGCEELLSRIEAALRGAEE